ncbi:hypothetical protein C1N80_03565 [Brachybacterium sp. SGAir0954]|nr:hypothetical protein C1N80_03565 [Brachybacterium sp. SGAir0954]
MDAPLPYPRRRPSQPLSIENCFAADDSGNPYLRRQRLFAPNGDVLVSRSRKGAASPFNVTSTLLPSQAAAGRPYREITAVRKSLREEQPENFLFSGHGGLMLPRSVRENEARWAAVREWYNAAYRLYETQTDANFALSVFLHGISYLGPLRSLPLRTYRMSAEPPSEVGVAGESAPELLFRERGLESKDEVDSWLNRLGYGRLEFEAIGSEYFQAKLHTPSGLKVNLADTGVGLSQVIPLLTQGVVAPAGATIISQQPEIHLNPAQQSILADFLINRSKSGVRTVVETHSEHLLMRVRRRIAEGELSAEDVNVYFVESKDGQTSLRKIVVGEYGEVDRNEWPNGFFEDQLQEAFSLAAAQAIKGGMQ